MTRNDLPKEITTLKLFGGENRSCNGKFVSTCSVGFLLKVSSFRVSLINNYYHLRRVFKILPSVAVLVEDLTQIGIDVKIGASGCHFELTGNSSVKLNDMQIPD